MNRNNTCLPITLGVGPSGAGQVVDVAIFGAVGDGVTDDRAALQSAIDYAQGRKMVLELSKPRYFVSTGLQITSDLTIRANNSELVTNISATPSFLRVEGSISAFTPVLHDIVRGQNWIKCATLAPSLSPGDIIKVYSDQPFCDSLYGYQESSGRGEMKIVRNVVGENIYTDPFEWWYQIANWSNGSFTNQPSNLSVAKVTPIHVDILGNLKLRNLTTDFVTGSNTNRGAFFQYLANSTIEIIVQNFAEYGISAYHCVSNAFDVKINNAVRDAGESADGSPGYGFELCGTSMNNIITGVIKNCRHCFAYNASAGVGWENTVSVDATGSRGNGTLDCHAPCGSIEFTNCRIRGGARIFRPETTLQGGFDPAVSVDYTQPYGIEAGAKFTYITNCTFQGVKSPIQLREAHELDSLIINNIHLENCTDYAIALRSTYTTGSYVKGLSINGVYGSCVGLLNIPSTSSLAQTDLIVSNVNIRGGVSTISGNATLVNIVLNNVFIDFLSANAGMLVQNFTDARLLNCIFRNSAKTGAGALDVKAITKLLDIQGCEFNNVVRPVNWTDAAGTAGDFSGYTTITETVRFTGNLVKTVSQNNGVLSMPNYTKFTNLVLDNNILDDNDLGYITGRGTGSACVNLFAGANVTHTAYYMDVQNEVNITYKIISGTVKEPRVVMGKGTPEGVLAAKVGAIFLREDGGATTTLYVKTSGTSTTGWTAK